jgi:surface protein
MKEYEFIYMNKKYMINNSENNNNVFHQFSSLINQDIIQIIFYYKCKKINISRNFNCSKRTNIKIFVYKKNGIISKKSNIKNIICPECNYLSFLTNININEEGLVDIKCINGHNSLSTLDSFIDSQMKDESTINCSKCNNNKYYYNDVMYINNSNEYICPLCIATRDKVINYNYQYSMCNIHKLKYLSYCNKCKINLCEKCEQNHRKHKIIQYKKIRFDKKRVLKIRSERIRLNKNLNDVNELKSYFSEICDYLLDKMKNYKHIYDYLVDSMENLDNFENINNSVNFDLQFGIGPLDFNYINNDNIIKITNILNAYEKRPNIMTLTYDKSGDIQLFGHDFVNINKNKCYLLINNKKSELIEKYHFTRKDEKRTIYLVDKNLQNSGIINMGFMFDKCTSLYSLPDISKWNTKDVKSMSGMFSGCSSLKELPDISKWNINNVKNMSWMFSGCSSLKELPDISKWHINNILNITGMFSGCSSLKELPDISQWDTISVTDMKGLFNECSSLKELPNISTWNISNAKDLSELFRECSSLKYLPDISIWNTSNIIKMSGMFDGCKSLDILPDISQWNINKLSKKYSMFNGCKSTLNIPDKFKSYI